MFGAWFGCATGLVLSLEVASPTLLQEYTVRAKSIMEKMMEKGNIQRRSILRLKTSERVGLESGAPFQLVGDLDPSASKFLFRNLKATEAATIRACILQALTAAGGLAHLIYYNVEGNDMDPYSNSTLPSTRRKEIAFAAGSYGLNLLFGIGAPPSLWFFEVELDNNSSLIAFAFSFYTLLGLLLVSLTLFLSWR